ncbi:hypothetical protein N0V88_004251 [Collariella sp. IMI 366227]|nr:hypothetical protein N0V88_004251 [Collariella sp. IMI 366227]
MAESCTVCHKAPPEVTLKRCAKCSTTPYCSRDCQKADWKTHKKLCGKAPDGNPMGNAVLSPPKGLDQPITQPFTRLDNGTFLQGRPEKDAYRLLIDAYRLRVEDNYTLEGDADIDSIYGGEPNGLKGFRRFLQLASSRPGLLPMWWNAEKQRACEAFGMDASNFQDLRCTVGKSDIIEHYGDPRFPMQLRMLAEAFYGRGPGGQDGSPMRGMMVAMEQRTAGPAASAAMIDVLTGNTSTIHSLGRK